MAASCSPRPESTETKGSRSATSASTAPGARPTAPTSSPASRAPRAPARATPTASGDRRCSGRPRVIRRSPADTAPATAASRSTRRGPQREATSSSRGTTRPAGHRLQGVPAGAGRHRLRRLAAAPGVGQEDEVRVGGQDELGAQLRVAGAGAVGRRRRCSPCPRRAKQAAHEGPRGEAVEGGVELVVVGERAASLGTAETRRSTSPADGGHQRLRLGLQSGGRPQRPHLAVGVLQGEGRGEEQGGDAQGGQAGAQVTRVVGEHHQVRVEGRHRLHPQVEGVQLGGGCRLRREVGELVGGHHPRPRPQGVEDLGVRRRRRHDALRRGRDQRAGDLHGEASRRAGGGSPAPPALQADGRQQAQQASATQGAVRTGFTRASPSVGEEGLGAEIGRSPFLRERPHPTRRQAT